MLRAEINAKGRIQIDGVEYRDREGLKELAGHSFRNEIHTIPLTWPALRVLTLSFPDRVDYGTELLAWAWREHATRIAPALDAHDWAMNPENDVDGYAEDLYPYQRTGIDFLITAESAALTDEMGTGKTVHAITIMEEKNAYPALIVCPKSAMGGWRREFHKWAEDVDVCIVEGSANERRKILAEDHDVFILTWESLRHHSRLAPYGSIRLKLCAECKGGDPNVKPAVCEVHLKELNRPWKAVVADEAHRALDPKTKQTRALWAIGASAEIRIPMTGTPVANTPADFWSLMHFVSPDEWPSRTEYVDRYCTTMWNDAGFVEVIGLNPLHSKEFHQLVKPRHLRRPKELVLPWLPPKVYEVREIEMSAGQRKVYNQLQKEMLADLDNGTVIAIDPLVKLTRLTQAASSMLDIVDGEVRLAAPSTKVDAMVELLHDMGDEPLVVFAQSAQLIEIAAQRLDREKISYSKIVGGQSSTVRYSNEMEFSDGTNRVILLTMGAGSESLTLVRASTTCFLQRSWKLIENRQAEGRTDRPGQEAEKILIVDFLAPGTVEEGQNYILQAKSDMLEEIVRDREALSNLLRRTW